MNSCQDWLKSGQTASGTYTVYPDGVTAIVVYCDMSVSPAAAVLSHNLIQYTAVPKNSHQATVTLTFSYTGVTMENARLLVQYSATGHMVVDINCSKQPVDLNLVTRIVNGGNQVTGWSFCSSKSNIFLE